MKLIWFLLSSLHGAVFLPHGRPVSPLMFVPFSPLRYSIWLVGNRMGWEEDCTTLLLLLRRYVSYCSLLVFWLTFSHFCLAPNYFHTIHRFHHGTAMNSPQIPHFHMNARHIHIHMKLRKRAVPDKLTHTYTRRPGPLPYSWKHSSQTPSG